jgi:hypothetical protein
LNPGGNFFPSYKAALSRLGLGWVGFHGPGETPNAWVLKTAKAKNGGLVTGSGKKFQSFGGIPVFVSHRIDYFPVFFYAEYKMKPL